MKLVIVKPSFQKLVQEYGEPVHTRCEQPYNTSKLDMS